MKTNTTLGLLLTLVASAAPAADCTVRAQNLNFGTLKASEQRASAIGSLTVFCSGQPGEHVDYTLSLNRGSSSGSFDERRMADSDAILPYNLYLDAAHTRVWGDGSAGSDVLHGTLDLTGFSAQRQYPVYADSAVARQRRPGRYLDTINALLDY